MDRRVSEVPREIIRVEGVRVQETVEEGLSPVIEVTMQVEGRW